MLNKYSKTEVIHQKLHIFHHHFFSTLEVKASRFRIFTSEQKPTPRAGAVFEMCIPNTYLHWVTKQSLYPHFKIYECSVISTK